MRLCTFDVISDLYLKTLKDFSWEDKATSLFCIVAGNISSDHDILVNFLKELSNYYEAVFFIDGDLEHDQFGGDFYKSYASLRKNLANIDKVVFLHENIVIINEATLLATNGWTTFNFTNKNSLNETMDFLEEQGNVPGQVSNDIFKMAVTDQHYMYNSIQTCQTMSDVENIIIITNSVPLPELIAHDHEYNGTILGDTAGNNGITGCLDNDTEHKVKTWIFGKYHGDLDFDVNGVRYLNNPGINKDLKIYFPKIIKF